VGHGPGGLRPQKTGGIGAEFIPAFRTAEVIPHRLEKEVPPSSQVRDNVHPANRILDCGGLIHKPSIAYRHAFAALKSAGEIRPIGV